MAIDIGSNPRAESATAGNRVRIDLSCSFRMDASDSRALAHSRTILESRSHLRLLVLGDSVAVGLAAGRYYTCFAWLWANYLRQKYEAPVHLINESTAGRTSADGVRLAEFAAREYQPDLALIAFGLNDQRVRKPSLTRPGTWQRAPQIPPDRFRANIARIADHIRRRAGADIVLVTPCPLPGLEENETYRMTLVSMAERNGYALADVGGAWPADGSELLAPDGLHPNDSGHRVYVETLKDLGL
jgi:lysophospholipase L1-like esterase